jgi:dihydrofolate synthase/folylpolyglutamate synthase
MSPGDAALGASPAPADRERAALDWLYSFSDWERGVGWNRDAAPDEVWKLGRTRALLDLVGSPDAQVPIVHVAGTKGKGSTVAYLESIVRAAGWRTVAYTQPHLHTFRERIRVDGQPIAPDAFADGVDRLRGLVDRLAEQHPDAGAPTTFELTTVLAVLAAQAARADLLIAEVGLGGRLDATNALATDLAVITRIGLDHRQILGNTLAEIAAEKVAIARPGQTVLSAVQSPSARDVIARHCEEVGASLKVVRPLRPARTDHTSGRDRRLGPTGLLHGAFRHQRQNAALAVAAAEALADRSQPDASQADGSQPPESRIGLPLTARAIDVGLHDAWLPARLEVVGLHPRLLVDAAHNSDSARALAEELRAWHDRPLWLVLGILRDKDARAILRLLLPLADGVVVVTPTSPRALPAEALAEACRSLASDGAQQVQVEQASSVAAALDLAKSRAGRDGGVAVAGSFATASEARATLGLEAVVTAEGRQAWLAAGGLEP